MIVATFRIMTLSLRVALSSFIVPFLTGIARLPLRYSLTFFALMLTGLMATLMPALVGMGRLPSCAIPSIEPPKRNTCAHH